MRSIKLQKITLIMFLLLFSTSFVFSNDSLPKKKVVFVKDDDGAFFNAVSGLMNNLIVKKGWTSDKAEYIALSIEGKESRKAIVIEEIIKINPDVVLMNTTLVKDIAMKLKEAGIPCVSGGGLELEDENGEVILVDENGYPTTNLTGTYTMPRTHLANSFFLLNEITPLNNKKVVFATYPSAAFTKKKVEEALAKYNFQLKDHKEFLYVDDYQDFVEKYNNDPEVGWIISGEMISRKKDGSAYTFEEFFKWEREHTIKPNVGFWENATSSGKLCALAIDSMTTVDQMISMADRVLNGENVHQIKPEDPARTLVILNQKRAQDIGVDFSIEMLGAAWKIYTDYEGNFLERE